MTLTKHGIMRFKQRQKIKNKDEMRRKLACAIERGKLLDDGTNQPGTKCYLFDGYCYIVTNKKKRLVTVFRPNKHKTKSKKSLLEDIKIKEFDNELQLYDDSLALGL